MLLNRIALSNLKAWSKGGSTRKPLVVLGARQVGKTHLIKHFGASSFRAVHYFNFEELTDLAKIFDRDLIAKRIVQDLELYSGQQIIPSADLLVFDEIQACPRALTSLKYFSETFPELAVCAAGSLLGLELAASSFPVGKVQLLDLFPLSFFEFVEAVGGTRLTTALQSQLDAHTFSDTAHDQLWKLLKLYFVSGGLPACVTLCTDKSLSNITLFSQLRTLQHQMIRNYLADMAKHCGKVDAMQLERVFRSVSTQISQVQDESTQRFRMSGVVPGVSQYSRLVNAFDWLSKAGLIIKVQIIQKPTLPLVAQVKESRMKVFTFDIGLLGAMANIDPATIYNFDFGTYKGFLAENFVAQELRATGIVTLYSWHESQAEVEFVLEHADTCVPLEVKSGSNTRSRSLWSYIQRYAPDNSFILSAKRLSPARDKNSPHMLPLYLAAYWHKLMDKTFNTRGFSFEK